MSDKKVDAEFQPIVADAIDLASSSVACGVDVPHSYVVRERWPTWIKVGLCIVE